LTAVYICLVTGTASLLEGCLLLLFSSQLFTLDPEVFLQLHTLCLCLKQVSVHPDKLHCAESNMCFVGSQEQFRPAAAAAAAGLNCSWLPTKHMLPSAQTFS